MDVNFEMSQSEKPPTTELYGLHATISGRVHGVGFRVFILDLARRLKLTGWVRNTPEGNVELYAVGYRPNLEHLLQAIHTGPPAARVSNVQFYWTNVAEADKPARFEVRN